MTIEEKIEQFRPQAEMMPGVVVIHEIEGFKPVFMSTNGLELLGLEIEDLIETGEDYKRLFLNPDFMEDYLKQLKEMLYREKSESTYTFFTQVRYQVSGDFLWYVSSLKTFHRDNEGNPTHTLTISVPMEDYSWTSRRAERLLAQDDFRRRNQKKFVRLGEREKEVLGLVALGKTSAEISEELHIAPDTVNSHRKKIKEKLRISSAYEFTKYAHSFDLI